MLEISQTKNIVSMEKQKIHLIVKRDEVNAADALDVDVMMHLEEYTLTLNEVYPQVEFIVSVIEE